MKNRKRKRSAQATPAVETSGVDAVAVENPTSVDVAPEHAVELSPTAVEALVAEPVETVGEVYAAAETLLADATKWMDTAGEPAFVEAVESVDSTAETVVADTAAPVAAAAETALAEAIEFADAPTETTFVEAVEPTDAVAETISDETAVEPVLVETAEVVEATADIGAADSTEAVATTVESAVVEASEPVAAELVAAEPAPVVEPLVVLGANCSVKDAAALKTSLCALAQQSTEVTLDVSAVERVDTATMQLLCAFVRDRSGRNQSVTWRGESQALQDAVRLLGVGELLGLEPKGVAA
ncbi:MAG TPA: STAS domain-containing protein [Steroidobacter sp.]|uniref:STAS domain-containing protein n=1 Tax=Steroidobacter sp. TaxID=1978227 RepID=UPI002ED88C36